MDKYGLYIEKMTDKAPNQLFGTATPAANATSADGEYTIDKTFAQLQAMFEKGYLSYLNWHQDGVIIRVPLTAATIDTFVFSTTVANEICTFTLDSGDNLTFSEKSAGAGGSQMKVVDAGGDGKPDVASPDPSVVYLTPGASSSDPYTRWVYSDGTWTDIGTTDVDLSDYYTKGEVDAFELVGYGS